METIVLAIVVIFAVGFVIAMGCCSVAPFFITKDMTEGDNPAVKIGQGE